MSTVRAVLERLNDLEATITQVERDVVAKRSFATQLSLQSLENCISIVFESVEVKTSERIKANATTYGVPVVKRLYHMAKTHSQFDMNAEIKWVRDRSIKKRVLTQAPEFAKICRIIEDKSDT